MNVILSTLNSKYIHSNLAIRYLKEYVRDKSTKYNVYVSITEMDNDEVIDCIYIKEVN